LVEILFQQGSEGRKVALEMTGVRMKAEMCMLSLRNLTALWPPSTDEICKPSNGSKQKNREYRGRLSYKIGFNQNITCSAAYLQQNHALKTFQIKYKTKVHTSLLPIFLF
jgi:hypothetical protein